MRRANKWRDMAADMKPGAKTRLWNRSDANSLCRALKARGDVGSLKQSPIGDGKPSFVVVKGV